jgi:hypothetical protein
VGVRPAKPGKEIRLDPHGALLAERETPVGAFQEEDLLGDTRRRGRSVGRRDLPNNLRLSPPKRYESAQRHLPTGNPLSFRKIDDFGRRPRHGILLS